jgi:lipid II:glycine glycyltransferase (peptidoglycan interpeptide bridge formation enzyme)
MKKQTVLTLGFATLLVCASQASQQQLAASIKEAREEAAQTRNQLVATLNTLTELTKQKKGDLRPAYNAFTADVPKTEAAAASTQKRVAFMEGDGAKYFDDWQTTVAGINNESLRKKAQKRLDAAKKSYAKVNAALKEATEKFKPFLSDLSDIQKALANDVTADGVKSLKSTVSDANWRYKFVNRSINDALEEMQKMEKSLSTAAE